MTFLTAIGLMGLLSFGFAQSQGDQTASENMPQGVLKALAADEKEYCEQFFKVLKRDCREEFRTKLSWRKLVITPSGKTAILVENKNMSFCGSAGCPLYLFVQQSNGKFVQILGPYGEVGALANVNTLKTVTKGHFDLQKTWHDGKTRTTYQWDGSWYSDDRTGKKQSSPD